jgi:DNA-directed RNA polymerase subunit alpha
MAAVTVLASRSVALEKEKKPSPDSWRIDKNHYTAALLPGAPSNSGLGRAVGSLLPGREPMSRTRIPLEALRNPQADLVERLQMSTAEIGLSVRTTNCLEERGIFTVNDLLHCTRDDLLSISNFGEKTLEEVYKALESIGFYRRSRQAELAGV